MRVGHTVVLVSRGRKAHGTVIQMNTFGDVRVKWHDKFLPNAAPGTALWHSGAEITPENGYSVLDSAGRKIQ